ncbi:putative exporter [Neisseria sp. HSC-16F19]|nr:hypothetical protein [Neisseria sp. HSC-16F19]MCP2040746.1 putative exporter [Neisseria sp. HSC-16F19]
MRLSRYAYSLLMLLVLAWCITRLANGSWLQTDLTALMPQETRPDVLLQQADAANEARLNGQVVMLVGAADADTAFAAAAAAAHSWQESGVFAAVDSRIDPDLEHIRREASLLAQAVLPEHARSQLAEQPQQYFQTLAEDWANPFAAASPLPPEQDWLGFGRFVTEQLQSHSTLQWQPDNGMLYTETEDGLTWVWLRGRLPQGQTLTASPTALLPLMQHSRALAEAQGATVLQAGGALFAATAKAEAERESRLMSLTGLSLTFALLLWAFRSPRVFVLALPLAAGMLSGVAAGLWVFGEIHVLTLVIGTSLVGMLVDFPLHWLAPSAFAARDGHGWQAQEAMRHVRPTFVISLTITVLGYVLLWFTPLPVLRQTAVFSAAALIGAFGATLLWLPPLFARYRNRAHGFAALTAALYRVSGSLQAYIRHPVFAAAALLLLGFGLWRTDGRDDIRQWVAMPPQLLAEVEQIGRISGSDFSGRFVLVEADNSDALLAQSRRVRQALAPLQAQGSLDGIQGLDQWLADAGQQAALRQTLRDLAAQPAHWQPLRDLGVPDHTIRAALLQAADAPDVGIATALDTALAEAWQPAYLGEAVPGRFAAVVRLHGLRDAAAAQAALSGLPGVHWVDQRGRLNSLFEATRNQAAWLKLASFVLAWLLLWRLFGLKTGSRILAVPLTAALATAAVLGWLGLPLSLFALFGLLLASAIGVDYAVYARTARHSPEARLGGMLLAALTTGISFALLGLSSTPAVAAFGLSVTLGVVFNLWLAARLLEA